MDDSIRRQAAIDLVRDVCDAILSGCGSHYDGEDEVYDDLLEVDAILKCNKEIRIALENMPSVQQWIPCSERTPDTDRYVLCTTENKKGVRTVVRGYYTGGSWAVGMNPNVIAWMEMPEPYQGGQ